MVWAAISVRGKTPLMFVDQKTKTDRHVYMEMLRAHLIPWANNAFSDDEWTFQQDGAPRYKAIETQNFIRANCPDFISVDTHWRNNDGEWPPNSPDLNPLDYSVKHSRRKSVCETPLECEILEASFEESMERNHLRNFDQDREQLSEVTEGLHGCKRRTF
uniref:Transposase n=1 Tax=Acrobeloides nanus TaxID=290746 RepID=A0A914EMC8_9BILA